jgi:hypothetical protein
VVVAVGLTLVELLAADDVKLPGVMATLVAPLATQLNLLLDPEVILEGLAANEVMVGFPVAFTVTVAVDVTDPAALVAVSVYVVVAAGLTLMEPAAAAEVNVLGVIAMVVAPLVAQLNVLLDPEFIVAGLAVNELMVGFPVVFTVTVAVDVTDPAAFVAISV